MSGTLYIVSTPIGNLEDITLRALRVLKEVALVAAEDTRAAQRLLGHFGIEKPTVSCFTGNEAGRAVKLVDRLKAGEDVALISEAGTPAISDPGERLVARAIEAGVQVVPVPGASAVLSALAASGLSTERFLFVGFLPRAEGARIEALGGLRASSATLVFYEAPGRTAATLADLAATMGGGRRACLARELTKMYEELQRGTLDELAARALETPPRGEVTLVVEGAGEELPAIDVEAEVRRRLAAGEGPKEIAAALALATGKPKRQIYQLALALRAP